MTTIVNLTSYSDADFFYSQPTTPVAVGANPLHLQLRVDPSDNTVWLEATSANGLITITNPLSVETVNLIIPVPNLLKLIASVYQYSLIMSSLSGQKRTELFRGTWTHNIGPTKWPAGTL